MTVIVEDLTNLPPKHLERRLEELATEALPCLSASVFSGGPDEGLAVEFWIDPRERRDVRDLARVLETEPNGYVFTSWASLSPNRRHPYWRLLLRVHFERPVQCDFVVHMEVTDRASDPRRTSLPLILAADRFVLSFEGPRSAERPAVWIPAPPARECVLDVLAAVGIS